MRVSDAQLAEIWDRGFTVVEGFLDRETLSAAQEALWEIYPRPDAYFADPSAFAKFAKSQFAGQKFYPFGHWALDRVPVYPDLLDAAERFLETREVDCYKLELWAKYAGAIDYDQTHHRDYPNHSLVVPRADQAMTQMTCFILLSDVTEADGPTRLVPTDRTRDIPLNVTSSKAGDFRDDEVAAVGPAGSILMYKTDVFHRGSDFVGPGRSRFVMAADFKRRGWPWQGRHAWPERAIYPGWTEAMVRMTPRQRDVFGWPAPGHPYWNAQTLADVAQRYPGIDLTSYAEACA